MSIVCIYWFWLCNFGCGDRGRWFMVWGRLFFNPNIRCWFMRKIEGPISSNSGRIELFCCNVWSKILGMILVIFFKFEEIGVTYVKLVIFCGGFTYGFVDRLSQLVGYTFHVAFYDVFGSWHGNWSILAVQIYKTNLVEHF